MHTDIYGITTALQTSAGLNAWNSLLQAFLAHNAKAPEHLGTLLQSEPQFAGGHALKGLFCLLLCKREAAALARSAMAEAQSCLSVQASTKREERFALALQSWLAGSAKGAIAELEQNLREHPEDALSMKLSHAIRFVLGDNVGMRRSLETVQDAYGSDHPALGYMRGCYAFALEETGEYALAERIGREAVAHSPDDAWGLHAVAHVHEMRAEPKQGLAWLTGREAAWLHCNNFRYHVWWHKALMHLDLGQIDAVLELYDHEIRCDRTDDFRDISNAASLLSRLELENVDIGKRWEELAELSANRVEDGALIFADLHYLLALIGGDRHDAAASMVARIAEDATAQTSDMKRAMANPGRAASEGLQAFGKGQYAYAFAQLKAARETMQRAGGSHAQRDVFERITIDAGIRAGMLSDARRILEERSAQRDGATDAFARSRLELIASGAAQRHNAQSMSAL